MKTPKAKTCYWIKGRWLGGQPPCHLPPGTGKYLHSNPTQRKQCNLKWLILFALHESVIPGKAGSLFN